MPVRWIRITVTGSRVQNRGRPPRAADAAAAPVAVTPPAARTAASGRERRQRPAQRRRTALRRTDPQVPVDEDTTAPAGRMAGTHPPAARPSVTANALRSSYCSSVAAPAPARPGRSAPAAGNPVTDIACRARLHLLEVKHAVSRPAAPVATPDDALAFLREIAVPDATAQLLAYRIGGEYRSSDDGEPAGTAGVRSSPRSMAVASTG